MKCNPTQTDIRTALEYRKAYHSVKQGQTAAESLEFLDSDNNNFIKDDGKYVLEGTTVSLRTTVTTELNKNNKFESETGQPSAKIGQFVHTNIEKASREILQEIEGLSTSTAITKIKNMTADSYLPDLSSGKKLDSLSKNNLFDLAKQQILFAYEEQHIINNRANVNAVPVIRFEQIVIDPVKSKGGTIDFLAILSDNTFIIRDYKTKMTTNNQYDASMNLKAGTNLVYYKALDKYKLQVAEYARILRKHYGFAGTHSNRLIPIRVFSIWNNVSQDYAPLVSRVAGPGQDNAIDDIIPFTEKTGFESLDKFLSGIDEKIAGLEDRKKKDVKTKADIQDRIDRLKELKKEIIIKKSVNNTLEHVKHLSSQLDNIESLSDIDLHEILGEFRMLESLSSATSDFRKYLIKEGKDVDEMDAKIAQTLSVIINRIEDVKFEISNIRTVKLIEEEIGVKVTNDTGDFIPLASEGAYTNWINQLSAWQNPYFKTLRSLLSKANYESRLAIDEITEEVKIKENAVIAKLKSSGKGWPDFIKLMINPKTDNFYTKGSSEFFQRMDNLELKELPAYYEVHDWWNWQEKFDKADALIIARLTVDGVLDEVTYAEELETWDKFNNLSLDSNNNPRYPTAWKNAKSNGRLKLKSSMVEESKEFKAIKAVPEYLAYYEMFEKYNEQFRKMLGAEYLKLPNNFLPNIRKAAGERIDQLGWLKGTQSSVSDFISDFSVREDETSDDGNYMKRNSIPKFFLNPFRDKTGNLIPGEKSYQFGRSLLIFAKMAHNYEQMNLIEANVLNLRETLIEKAEELTAKSGGIVTNFLGNNKLFKLKSTDIPNIFDKFVNMYVYGISVEPVLGDKSGKAEKALLQMKNYFTLKSLGLNFIAAAGGYVSAQIQARITGQTGIYYDADQYKKSVIDSGRDRTNFLALNAYFDVMGHRYGTIRLEEEKLGEFQIGDHSQRGWINKYVSTRTLMQPYGLGDNHIEEIIAYSVAQNYYVDEKGNLKKLFFPEDKIKYKDRTILALFKYEEGKTGLNLPNEQIRNIYMAFRQACQVVQSGIKGTIPEEDKAAWQSQLVGQMLMNFKSWMPGIFTERFSKVKYDDRVKTTYMGRYTAISQNIGNLKYNKTGAEVQLKDFIFKILLPKLGELTLNVLSFHTIGGYFKGYKMKDDGTRLMLFEKFLAENPQYADKISYAEYKDIQERQLKSAIVEMRILLTFAMLSVLLLGDWDDDGEKDFHKYYLSRKLASIFLKAQQELLFLYSPTQLASLTKSPIPMVGLLTDTQKAITSVFGALWNHTVGELPEGDDPNKDIKKAAAKVVSFAPGSQGFLRFIDALSNDIQYEQVQQ